MSAGPVALDHVVIGVHDIQSAERLLGARGFRVSAGGRHPGFGTENALVRFVSQYLELIRVADPDAARAAGRGTLVDRLATGDEGFVAFALRGMPLDTVIERADTAGVVVCGPVLMSRRSFAGRGAAWRLAIPYGDQYGGWWPFFIEWMDGGPGSQSYTPPEHPNGARRITEVRVAADGLGEVRALLEALGLFSSGANRSGSGADASDGKELCYQLGHTLLRFVEARRSPDDGRVRQGVQAIRIGTEPGASPVAASPLSPGWLRRIHIAHEDR